MIESFDILMIGPGFYLVTAIMHDGPPRQIGFFDSVEEIDRVCDQLMFEQNRRLN